MSLWRRRISRRTLLRGAALAAFSAPLLGARCREGFVDRAGIKIHYTVEGEGPAVLLHHGFMGSGAGWREYGYIDALAARFTVITIDARGHGKSDKPHDPALYTMQLRAGDVAAVLDTVEVERAHYWGYSMGGRTGFALAQYHLDRLLSLVNGAASPLSPKRDEERIRRGAAALQARDVAGIAAAFFVSITAAQAMIEGNDLDALAAAQLGLLSWDGVDPATLNVPSLHYAGDRDLLMIATQAAARDMPGARFEALPGLNHLTGFTQSSAVLPIVEPFLR